MHQSGWLVIAVEFTEWIDMIPALMFGNVSETIILPLLWGLAVSGYFEWGTCCSYICSSDFGAIFGQALVVATHRPSACKQQIQMQFWKFLQWFQALTMSLWVSQSGNYHGFCKWVCWFPRSFLYSICSPVKEYFELRLLNMQLLRRYRYSSIKVKHKLE